MTSAGEEERRRRLLVVVDSMHIKRCATSIAANLY
jgi:hypothetical protein